MTKIERFQKVIAKPTRDLTIKHIVYMNTKKFIHNKNVNGSNEITIPFARKASIKNGNDSLTFGTRDFIVLESSSLISTKTSFATQLYITYNDAPFIVHMVQTGEEWAKRSKELKIFTTDVHDNPVSVSAQLKHIVNLKDGHFIAIAPTVISDTDNVSYEGIVLYTNDGVFTMMTMHEFMSFSMIMKNVCLNLYSDSNSLVIMGMLYLLFER